MTGSETLLKKVPGTTVDERAPWWWNAIVTFMVQVGIPVTIALAFTAFLLWERYTTLKDQKAQTEAMIRQSSETIKVLERVVPVLERMERKLER